LAFIYDEENDGQVQTNISCNQKESPVAHNKPKLSVKTDSQNLGKIDLLPSSAKEQLKYLGFED
jgi:hypothetical protein